MTDAAETESTSATETKSPEVTESESTSAPEKTSPEKKSTEKKSTEKKSTEKKSAGETAAPERNARKVREGLVTSNSMDRTAVVTVTERKRHRKYNKTMRRDRNLYVHDAENDLNVGDRVRVMETRPMSKTKRWRVIEVLERAR